MSRNTWMAAPVGVVAALAVDCPPFLSVQTPAAIEPASANTNGDGTNTTRPGGFNSAASYKPFTATRIASLSIIFARAVRGDSI